MFGSWVLHRTSSQTLNYQTIKPQNPKTTYVLAVILTVLNIFLAPLCRFNPYSSKPPPPKSWRSIGKDIFTKFRYNQQNQNPQLFIKVGWGLTPKIDQWRTNSEQQKTSVDDTSWVRKNDLIPTQLSIVVTSTNQVTNMNQRHGKRKRNDSHQQKQTKLTTSGLMTAYKTLKFQHVHEVSAGNNEESPPILQCFRTFSTPMLLNWGIVPRELAPNMQNEFRCLPKGKLPVAEEI